MKNGISLLSLFCLSVMALAGSRTVQVDREVFSGKLNKAYWDKDYLIAIVLDASANAAQARVVARDGRRFDLHASVAGAQHVRIRHVAATPQGGLVATVEAIGPTGEVAGALYFYDPDGKIKEIVRTNPFLANMLVVDLSGDVGDSDRKSIMAPDTGPLLFSGASLRTADSRQNTFCEVASATSFLPIPLFFPHEGVRLS
jgi:hypothetical protein